MILRWLAEEHRPSGRPTADELIALKRAGATDELVAVLLDLAAAGTRRPRRHPSRGEPAPVVPATPRRPGPDRGGSGATAAPAPAGQRRRHVGPAAAPPRRAGRCRSRCRSSTSTSPRRATPGISSSTSTASLSLPVPAARTARNAEPSRTLRDVAPGLHVLRWAQERHGERPGERGLHAARFDPEPLAFTLTGGAPAEIAFEFRDPSGIPFATAKGPITVHVTQGGKELDARREGGGEAARWPNLCEEIEANLAGGKPSFQDRMLLKSCLRWADLWSALPGPVPDRDSVRQRLAP